MVETPVKIQTSKQETQRDRQNKVCISDRIKKGGFKDAGRIGSVRQKSGWESGRIGKEKAGSEFSRKTTGQDYSQD